MIFRHNLLKSLPFLIVGLCLRCCCFLFFFLLFVFCGKLWTEFVTDEFEFACSIICRLPDVADDDDNSSEYRNSDG